MAFLYRILFMVSVRLFLLLLFMVSVHEGMSQNLSEIRWENRVVFILNPPGAKAFDHPQISSFNDYEKEIQDRDILIFVLHQEEVYNLNREAINMEIESIPFSTYTGLILIGKDGGVKLKDDFVVKPERIFDLIDSMPMRRAEIKRSEKY